MYQLFSYQSVRCLHHLLKAPTFIAYAWSRYDTEAVAKLPTSGRIGVGYD